jgi:hypothetical protein
MDDATMATDSIGATYLAPGIHAQLDDSVHFFDSQATLILSNVINGCASKMTLVP